MMGHPEAARKGTWNTQVCVSAEGGHPGERELWQCLLKEANSLTHKPVFLACLTVQAPALEPGSDKKLLSESCILI